MMKSRAVEASPGIVIGRNKYQSAFHTSAPSMRAASNMPLGTFTLISAFDLAIIGSAGETFNLVTSCPLTDRTVRYPSHDDICLE
jgi:hypothetical protein